MILLRKKYSEDDKEEDLKSWGNRLSEVADKANNIDNKPIQI